MVKLEEIVGHGKAEEEPEGEVIAGPSREAVEPLSSDNTTFFLFGIKSSFFVTQVHCCKGSHFF